MKTIGAASQQALTTLRTELDQPKSTALALPPREKPLTVADFGKLEDLVERDCVIKPITKSVNVPKKDEGGYIYGWDFELVTTGLAILPISDIDARLIEALQRPATAKGTIYHFTRLAAAKRNTRGDKGFQIILEDLAYDLRGKSEWAIIKTCEFFRKQPSPFFPDYDVMLRKVEYFHDAAQKIQGGKSEG